MKFLLQNRWGCCRRPSVTRLYRRQEHSSGIKCSEKTENALKTKSAPDEKKTSTDEQHIMEIKDLVLKNRGLSIRELADTIFISRRSVNTILKYILGQTTRGFCITIMHWLTLHWFFDTFSPKIQLISFHNHHIRLIWLRVTTGYSLNWKDHSEDTVLTWLKRYKPNRRRLWRQFRKSNLTNVSTIEKHVGVSALYRERITLEGMKLIWINK